jgi:alpha-beta hydrolase superfamily lysophospholipase
MDVIYLHGFVSSPESSKARALGERLARCGVRVQCPDLNQPDFGTLTVSRMVAQVEALVAGAGAPVVLVGSSLGAFVALHVAQRQTERGRHADVSPGVTRLVLLAPALDFGHRGMTGVSPEGLDRWRVTNQLEVEHYAEGRRRHVHYALYADAQRYDSFTTTTALPTLILQGSQDAVVDPAMVQRFAAGRAHVRLVSLDDDHQLTASLDRVWQELADFLALSAAVGRGDH